MNCSWIANCMVFSTVCAWIDENDINDPCCKIEWNSITILLLIPRTEYFYNSTRNNTCQCAIGAWWPLTEDCDVGSPKQVQAELDISICNMVAAACCIIDIQPCDCLPNIINNTLMECAWHCFPRREPASDLQTHEAVIHNLAYILK